MAMPVPVKLIFEDGTEQTATTDRNRPQTRLTVSSSSKLRDVILDPEGRLAMVKQPVPKISGAASARLSYGWVTRDAPQIYADLKNQPVLSANLWYRLGWQLYDSDQLAEALDCFAKVDGLEADRLTRFAARGWRGLIEDLRGNRAAALERYKEALDADPGEALTIGPLRIKMDKAWLEARLQKAFVRESEISLPARPTAADLIAAIGRMGYAHEGKNPLLIFEKTRGLEIKSIDFWFKLGLQFDSGYYRESLASFEMDSSLAQTRLLAFAAWAWQGHLHDLLGNRERALACYKEALKLDTGSPMQHDQYRMVIDRDWIEERMKSPFTWNR
jgi:tetratricopeptide (TPR) repeat protein